MIKIGAIFIPVKDVERAVEWYKEKLNLHHVGTWPENKGADFYFTEEKQYITLVKVNEVPPLSFLDVSGYKNSFFNFTTHNLEQYRNDLLQKGVNVGEIVDYGPVLGFEIYDLDGNRLDVIVDKVDVAEFYKDKN